MDSQSILPILVLVLNLAIPVLSMGALRVFVERRWPIEAARRRGDGLNIVALMIWLPAQLLANPAAGALGVLLANRLGGGFIALPTHGWGLAGGFVVYLLAMDLVEYLFHRAQHAVPWLWSMHSLHHSDAKFDSTTSVLHHWGPPMIKTFVISAPLGLVFKVPAVDLAIYTAIGYYAYFIHANVRLDFGRFAWALVSPSYHRVHHSRLPEHFDCNYAAVLPIWDVLFGTYRPARPGEWPVVGLADGAEARTLFDLVFWPVREPLRALAGRSSATARTEP